MHPPEATLSHPRRVSLLDPKTAEAIAAGEVIERPSSVVKELVENALDSGATEIEVHLEEGGKALIEVVDNGTGIDPEDLSLAVLRHATSKIRSFSDLEQLGSFGFRGEALPSISAVTDLSITSRIPGARSAFEWRQGRVSPSSQATFAGASSHGTRARASGLFNEIPARLKFLKSATSEVSAVRDWIERLALTHPGVGFRLTHGTKELLRLRPETESQRVMSILADGSDYPLVQFFKEEVSGLQLRLYWIQGLNSPQTRNLIQVVNRRAIRDRLVQQALLLAFKQALLPGQFPALVAYLETPPQLLDVNVHPAKTEVRFLNSSQIFKFIESTASEMIAAHGVMGFAGGVLTSPVDLPLSPSPSSAWVRREDFALAQTSGLPAPETQQPDSLSLISRAPLRPSDQQPLQFVQAHPFSHDRLLGTVFQTYILYDLGQELALVDQHAAHERIRFEKLKARAARAQTSGESQALLIPEIAHYPAEQESFIETQLETLNRLGFEAENFGNGKLLFRGIPAEWSGSQLRVRLQAFLDRYLSCLEEGRSPELAAWDEVKFEKLASEACHSAIRAGDRLSDEQAQGMVDELFQCEHPWNCPHGRPTVARVPRSRFEEWFQRRV